MQTVAFLHTYYTPLALAATAVGRTTLTAHWSGVDWAHYEWDLSLNSGFTSYVYQAVSTPHLYAGVTGLTLATPYYYRVRGVGPRLSPASNIISATTTTVPEIPVALPATNITGSYFTANWQPVEGATAYTYEVATTSAFTSLFQTVTICSGTPTWQAMHLSATLSYDVIGITTPNTYWYRILAANSYGASEASNVITTGLITNMNIGVPYEGGVIAYLWQPGDTPYVSGYTGGLIAYPSDFVMRDYALYPEPGHGPVYWAGNPTSLVGTTQTGLGYGLANSNILSALTYEGVKSMAYYIRAWTGCTVETGIPVRCPWLPAPSDYNDWFQPSKAELEAIIKNRRAIGQGYGVWLNWTTPSGVANPQGFEPYDYYTTTWCQTYNIMSSISSSEAAATTAWGINYTPYIDHGTGGYFNGWSTDYASSATTTPKSEKRRLISRPCRYFGDGPVTSTLTNNNFTGATHDWGYFSEWSWTPVVTTQYTIQHSTNSAFTSPVTIIVTGTSWLVTGLTATTYWFRMGTQGLTGGTNFSNVVPCTLSPVDVLSLGQSYLGGTICHFWTAGEPDYVPYQDHGLIITDYLENRIWGQDISYATTDGNGMYNTQLISGDTTSAAYFCASYTGGSHAGWYQPSNAEIIAYGDATLYWSSTQVDTTRAKVTGTAGSLTKAKNLSYPVRAMAKF